MMRAAGLAPDVYTYTSLLHTVARAAAARGGRGGWTRGWQQVELLDTTQDMIRDRVILSKPSRRGGGGRGGDSTGRAGPGDP